MSSHSKNPPPDNVRKDGLYYKGAGTMLDTLRHGFTPYLHSICKGIEGVQTRYMGEEARLEETLEQVAANFRKGHKKGGRVIFIGNGGSAAIASHMAVDYTKNAGIRALALNDPAFLTCFSNDFSFEEVFAKQLKYYARPEDTVVLISSSGKSPNILRAAAFCVEKLSRNFITLSGMSPENPLRQRGYANFYVPSMDYGVVEIAHLALLHSIASVEL